MQYCPNCGQELDVGWNHCHNCGQELTDIGMQNKQQKETNQEWNQQRSQQKTPPPPSNQQRNQQKTPPPNQQRGQQKTPPPRDNLKSRNSNTGKIIGISVVIGVVILALLWLMFSSGGGGPFNPSTGKLQVKYDSALGNDVKIYLDGELLGTIPSDEWETFEGIEKGEHEITAKDLDGMTLDSKTINVEAGETTSVTLSYW